MCAPKNLVVIKDASDLENYVGKKVAVEGTISNIYWQHLIDSPPTHPKSSYFDIGNSQIVIYSKEDINCSEKLRIVGTVIKLGGQRKPDRKETATEYHIVVDNCESME
ncbi:MAG: hypothetical protein WED05_07410 [Candidatus Atabeyarchaeum deiterrae]|jgi:hypothetical protein